MQILYVAHERRAAEPAIQGLRESEPGVNVAWADSLSSARRWVEENPDVAALIVDAEVHGQSSASFVSEVRELGLTAPVVVVTTEQLGVPLAELKAGADDYVVSRQHLLTDLPAVVAKALRRTRMAQTAAGPLRILYIGDAAVARRCLNNPQCPVEIAEALPEANGTPSSIADTPCDILLIEYDHPRVDAFAILKDIGQRGLRHPVILVVEWDEKVAVPAFKLGAVDYVLKTPDAFRALFFKLYRGSGAVPVSADAALATLKERAAPNLSEAIARQREAELEERLAQETARRTALEQAQARAESAREQAARQSASELAGASARLAEAQVQHQAAMGRAARVCRTLEQRLLELASALRHAEQQRASEAAASVDQLAQRHAEFTASLAQASRSRDALAQQLSAAMAALEEVRQKRTAEAAAAAAQLERREAELGGALADSEAARTALEARLSEATATLQRSEERAVLERDAVEQAAVRREAELAGRLAQEATARESLEQNLADAQAALQDATEQHASELAAATTRLARVQRQYDASVSEAATERAALEERLAEAVVALNDARQQRASEASAAAELLAQREGEFAAALAEAAAARTALDDRLAEAEAARESVMNQAEAGLAAAAERRVDLEDRLARETAARTILERDLAETRKETSRARLRLLEVASAIRQRVGDLKARLAAELRRERADHEQSLAAREEEIRLIHLEREKLQHSLATTQEGLRHQTETHTEEREHYERTRLANEAELQRLSAEYDQVQRSLDQVRASFQTLERVSGEHAVERARLESVVAERDAQLNAQAATHLAAAQVAEDALVELREKLRQALEAGSRETAQLRRESAALHQELEAVRHQADALRGEAGRVPVLQKHLEESQEEIRRQFNRAPYGICRCNPDGVITVVNQPFASLLGYGKAAELVNLDLAKVFESPADLRWLIERSLSTGTSELVETTWKKKDGRRLVVRLQILTTATETVAAGRAEGAKPSGVEIVAEDVTQLRALDDKLRHARRMEAVGRLASEIAVTCDNLLRDVSEEGRQWLASIGSDPALRQQGEALLAEVTRAAGFLRQFAVYGNKQIRTPEPVSVQRVLQDLEPVLKRVAGDDIELVLPKSSAPLDVDVDAERVERVLVNVASYARDRMPHGGRVVIDLGTAIVDRRFTAKYPNVRPGPHVVITVAEVRRPVRPDVALDSPTATAAEAGKSRSDKPGVDLGALLGLIGDCGGHLWMTAEPPGNMTLKIHLPKHVVDDAAEPAPPIARSDRARPLARWFRHA